MNSDWRAFLAGKGAVFADDGVHHFGDPPAERQAAAHGDVLLDTTPLALIRVTGRDAADFLHAQLTQDVRQLDSAHHRLAAYCTAQGRMLAIVRVFRVDATYYLQLPRSLLTPTLERLRRYVMRAHVVLEADDERIGIGFAGPQAPARVQQLIARVPSAGELAVTEHAIVLALPGPTPRFLIHTAEPMARTLWDQWQPQARPVGFGVWTWFDICAGVPTVLPPTVEAFVPQMTNLDLVGGISLSKGCYPGQEIVARMHYLGRLKQRMYRAWVDSEQTPNAGDAIYAPVFNTQSAGTVVAAQAAPEGGYDLLAVIQIAAVDANELHLHSPAGPPLSLLSLPYALPASTDRSS